MEEFGALAVEVVEHRVVECAFFGEEGAGVDEVAAGAAFVERHIDDFFLAAFVEFAEDASCVLDLELEFLSFVGGEDVDFVFGGFEHCVFFAQVRQHVEVEGVGEFLDFKAVFFLAEDLPEVFVGEDDVLWFGCLLLACDAVVARVVSAARIECGFHHFPREIGLFAVI